MILETVSQSRARRLIARSQVALRSLFAVSRVANSPDKKTAARFPLRR